MKKLLLVLSVMFLMCGCMDKEIEVYQMRASKSTIDIGEFMKMIEEDFYILEDKAVIIDRLNADVVKPGRTIDEKIVIPAYYYVFRVDKNHNINTCIDVYVTCDFYERFNVGDTIKL